MLAKLLSEKPLLLSIVAFGLFEIFGAHFAGGVGNLIGFIILFGVIIYSSLNVAHHAEMLAHKYGEPYGTLILTLSAVVVEIVIILIMMMHAHNPTLARDTIYSAIMLDVNGLLGIAALVGGIKHGEQKHNIDSTNSYISMILISVAVAMVIPHFVPEEKSGIYTTFIIVTFILLYAIFSLVQLKEHKYFFEFTESGDSVHHINEDKNAINGAYHASILVVSIIVIGLLSELLAPFMEHNIESVGLPMALGAFGVAIISASPELITAVKSALHNNMQTVINIAFGASLATILLTIPIVLVATMLMDFHIDLKLTVIQSIMIVVTLFARIIHFNDGETNMLEGFVHFVIFMLFFFLMFI